METGTLKELNVKPGDVVESIKHGYVETVARINGRNVHWGSGSFDWYHDAKFRIISRVAQNTPDLTAITTPFGLLDEATQEALRAHGGPYEYWFCEEWKICGYSIDGWDGDYVYRVKARPSIEKVTLYGWPDQFLRNKTGAEPLVLTYHNVDGEPDWTTLKVEAL